MHLTVGVPAPPAAAPRRRCRPSDSERHRRAKAFAARIAARLTEHRRNKRFDEMHLVAAPRRLGCLRKAFGPAPAAALVTTLDKDLVQESHAALTRRLFGPAGSVRS